MFQEIFAPDGQPSDMERIMLFSSWVKELARRRSGSRVIPAHMGRPTRPVDGVVPEAGIKYFNQIKAAHMAVDYGAPEGEASNRNMVAQALRTWYGEAKEDEIVPISADDVVFTVGGADGISVLLELLRKKSPNGKILLQEPWYPLYAKDESVLYPVNVMEEPGYRLTAALLNRSITKAKQEGVQFSAVLLCDPNNPLGTCIGRSELVRIARLLDEKLPNVPVILDQAYCEMGLYSKHISLVQVASPALRKRIVLLHSATKALSMSGERGAVAIIFDPSLRRQFVDIHVSRCGHAPKSVQYIYAHALKDFCENPERQRALVKNYLDGVEYSRARLKNMNAAMPDPSYRPEATFYVMADLSDLIGQPMPEEASEVFGDSVKKVLNSEHAAYKLLFETGISLAPADYFMQHQQDNTARSAYVRITCSGSKEELREMMDRLEQHLLAVRRLQYEQLTARLRDIIEKLDEKGVFDASSRKRLERFTSIMQCPNESIWDEASWMKYVNQSIVKMINSSYTMLCSVDSREKAAAALEDQLPKLRQKRKKLVDSFGHMFGERKALLDQTQALIAQLEVNWREIETLRQQLEKRGMNVDPVLQNIQIFRFYQPMNIAVSEVRRSRSETDLQEKTAIRALA